MEWHWSWALLLGGVAAFGGVPASRLLRVPRDSRSALSLPALIGGVGLAAVAFALCLPTRFPFSGGQQTGYGVLIGLAAALACALALWLARPGDDFASRLAASAGLGGVAVAMIAVCQIAFSGDPTFALFGALAGALLVVTPQLWRIRPEPLVAFGASAAVSGLGSLLAVQRYAVAAERPLWALPTLTLGAGLVGCVIGALVVGRSRPGPWLAAGIAAASSAGVCFASRTLFEQRLGLSVPTEFRLLLVLGWIAFPLAAALPRAAAGRAMGALGPPLIGVMLLIAGFNIAGGYGASIALAAGFPVALALTAGKRDLRRPPAFWLVFLGVLYLAYRLFLAFYADDLRTPASLEFGRHYAFLGIAAGLLWMGALRGGRPTSLGGLLHLGGLAFVPLLLFVVFGYEVLLGLALGMWIAHLSLPALSPRRWEWRKAPLTFPALVAIWALIVPRWAEFMLTQPRWVRGIIIGLAAAAILLVVGLLRDTDAEPAAEPGAE